MDITLLYNESVLGQSESQVVVNNEQSLISDKFKDMALNVIYMSMFFICLVGVVTNIINIRVFVHQGAMSGSTTVFMLGMAVSDLMGLVTLIPSAFCYFIQFSDYVVYRNCSVLTNVVFRIAHIGFARVTAFIYVCISVERALCVVFPFTAKQLNNPKRAVFMVTLIFAFFLLSYVPFFNSVRLEWGFNPTLNATLVSIKESSETLFIVDILIIMNSFVLGNLAMFIVAIATTTMLIHLKISRRRRRDLTSLPPASKAEINADSLEKPQKLRDSGTITVPPNHQPSQTSSSKELEIQKAVVGITLVYLVCMLANCTQTVGIFAVPGYSWSGVNSNLFYLMYGAIYFFDSINSSANFFIYVKLSSRYRQTLAEIFKTH